MTTIDMAETISTSLPVFNDVRAWYGPDLAQKQTGSHCWMQTTSLKLMPQSPM